MGIAITAEARAVFNNSTGMHIFLLAEGEI
jgi:hypothetical protein